MAVVTATALTTTPVATAVGFLPSLRSFDQHHILGSIRAHTTVVSGGADLLTPPAHARELDAAIPGCRHVHLPEPGHMLCQEAPHVVNNAITQTISLAASTPKSVGAQHRPGGTGDMTRPTVSARSVRRGDHRRGADPAMPVAEPGSLVRGDLAAAGAAS